MSNFLRSRRACSRIRLAPAPPRAALAAPISTAAAAAPLATLGAFTSGLAGHEDAVALTKGRRAGRHDVVAFDQPCRHFHQRLIHDADVNLLEVRHLALLGRTGRE